MATTQLPPTRVVSSKIVSPSEACKFLSRFIQKADQDITSHARGDLVLSDQRRIEQALQGVFMPKPKELSEEQVQGQTAVERPLESTGTSVQVSEVANGEEDGPWADNAVYREAQRGKIPESRGGAGPDDKQQRKVDKKARLKEEKRKRAEAREMERQ